jgi:hypothetical protein
VLEYDTPENLVKNQDSEFSHMLKSGH